MNCNRKRNNFLFEQSSHLLCYKIHTKFMFFINLMYLFDKKKNNHKRHNSLFKRIRYVYSHTQQFDNFYNIMENLYSFRFIIIILKNECVFVFVFLLYDIPNVFINVERKKVKATVPWMRDSLMAKKRIRKTKEVLDTGETESRLPFSQL